MSLDDNAEKTAQAIDIIARRLIYAGFVVGLGTLDETKFRQQIGDRVRELTEQFGVNEDAADAALDYLKTVATAPDFDAENDQKGA